MSEPLNLDALARADEAELRGLRTAYWDRVRRAEITIAGNLRDMLEGIAAVGDDVDARGGVRTGSILLGEMTIAGE